MFGDFTLTPVVGVSDQLAYLNKQVARTTDPAKLANLNTAIKGAQSGTTAPGGTDWVTYFKSLEMGGETLPTSVPTQQTGTDFVNPFTSCMDSTTNPIDYISCVTDTASNNVKNKEANANNGSAGGCAAGDFGCYVDTFGSSLLSIILGLVLVAGAFFIYKK